MPWKDPLLFPAADRDASNDELAEEEVDDD